MTKKLVWRLSKAPTVDELKTAVEASIISKEEAKEMLVRNEEDVPTDQLKEVKDELKLLRELVLAISSKSTFPSTIYPIVIREIERKTYPSPWTNPYITWCSSNGGFTSGSSRIIN